jgi:hypothetical protein
MKILFGGKTNWAENNADNRAGTWSYSSDNIKNLVLATIIVLAFSRGRSQQEINQASYDMELAFFLEGLGVIVII